MKRLAAAILAAGAAAGGCGGPPAQPWSPQAEATATLPRWETTLSAWTRREEAYEAFEGRLFVTATLLSPTFGRAWVEERARREGWTSDRRTTERAAADAAAQSALTFYVGVIAQDVRWDDAAPDGTLEMALTTAGGEFHASSVQKLSEDEIGDLLPYLTWVTPLHSLYRVTFPPLASPSVVGLRIAGPPAHLDLRWELPP